MTIQLPYDIIEMIMNKKHELEIEELKAANAVDKKKLNELIWYIQKMIEENFDDEMEEFKENYLHLCSEDEMEHNCLDYSKQVFKNESVSKIFSDILLYRWQEYILHNEETGEYPYDDDED